MSAPARYWVECITEACEEAGVMTSPEQIAIVARSAELAHEMHSEAMGDLCIPNPQAQENEKLRADLAKERDKRVCPTCHGTGLEVSHGPVHSAISSCFTCHGEGKK